MGRDALKRLNLSDLGRGEKKRPFLKKTLVSLHFLQYLSLMQDALTLTIGSKVKVSFFSNSGERKSDQGERKTLEGIVIKEATLAKTTQQYVVTLETAKGPRSFPCHTVTSLVIA